jgi:hypothetical protein
MNPWGADASRYTPPDPAKYGLFSADAPFLSQNFSSQSYGWGSEAGGKEGQHARTSHEELVDLAFIANSMDSHSKSRSSSIADYLPASLGL